MSGNLSIVIIGSSECENQLWIKFEPIKPAPPVTSIMGPQLLLVLMLLA